MELRSKLVQVRSNKVTQFLWCLIDIFSKYAWVVSSKDKKGIIIANAFQKILDNLKTKRNKIWADKFYNSCEYQWILCELWE